MKHLVLTQFGTPSESVALHDDRDPVPGPGDVLVRMEAAAVNPSDLLLRGLISRERIRPNISHVLEWTDIDEAVRILGAGEHIGKIALAIP